jgi:hypothetical protein
VKLAGHAFGSWISPPISFSGLWNTSVIGSRIKSPVFGVDSTTPTSAGFSSLAGGSVDGLLLGFAQDAATAKRIGKNTRFMKYPFKIVY